MPCIRKGRGLWVGALGMSLPAWGQGGGRAGRDAGAAAQQTGAPPAGAPAGTAGRGGSGALEFYNYDTTAGSGPSIPDSQPTETHQKITVNGETLAYTARAGYLPLRNATTGQSEAHLFYTCYAKDGVTDDPVRPLVFFLVGAPGVSAAWQEFGGFGPKRIEWGNDGGAGLPPYGWSDNPNTLLGQADLVFVNPVGTAFIRAHPPGRAASFRNTAPDHESPGPFVCSL